MSQSGCNVTGLVTYTGEQGNMGEHGGGGIGEHMETQGNIREHKGAVAHQRYRL